MFSLYQNIQKNYFISECEMVLGIHAKGFILIGYLFYRCLLLKTLNNKQNYLLYMEMRKIRKKG